MDYYNVEYQCSNCLRGWLIYIPVKQKAPNDLICPKCGINELHKTNKSIDWIGIRYLENGELIKK